VSEAAGMKDRREIVCLSGAFWLYLSFSSNVRRELVQW